jgi:predicted nucleotidyltransferase
VTTTNPLITDPILVQLVALATNSPDINGLWLYGSRARNQHTPASDYDLAVRFYEFQKDPIAKYLRPQLVAQQWRQALSIDVSVVDIELAPTPLAATITDEGHLLYDASEDLTPWLYQKIWGKWDEWKYNR